MKVFMHNMSRLRKFLHVAKKDFHATGFSRSVDRWEHCIELKGDYVENNIIVRIVRFAVVFL